MPRVSRSFRLRISLGISLMLIVVLAPLNWVQYDLQRRAAMREMERLSTTVGSVLEHGLREAMLSKDRSRIQGIVDSVAQTPGVSAIYLINPQAKITTSPGREQNGHRLRQNSPNCIGCHDLPADQRPGSIVARDDAGQAIFRTMTPILNRPECHRCHDSEDRFNGLLYIDFSMVGLNTRLEQGLRTAFLGSISIIALSFVVLYLLLSWMAITPMEKIAQGISRFSRGDREARVPVQRRDEVGQLAQVFNEMADTIQKQETKSQALYRELEAMDSVRRQLLARVITTREEESRRLSRRIHDELGQLLTGLSLHLKFAQQALSENPIGVNEHFNKIQDLLRHTIGQAYRLTTELRPAVLDDHGLAPAIRGELDERLAAHGISTHLEMDDSATQLPASIATPAFRIVQEALNNIIRHAQATEVTIRLKCPPQELLITVEDNGVGIPQEKLDLDNRGQALGLLGMQERAQAAGGQLTIDRLDPTGTIVSLRLPLNGATS